MGKSPFHITAIGFVFVSTDRNIYRALLENARGFAKKNRP